MSAPRKEIWADEHGRWYKPGGATKSGHRCFRYVRGDVADELIGMLEQATDRLEKCMTVNGTAPDIADIAVTQYRDAIAKARGS